jgi:hypothetical protein
MAKLIKCDRCGDLISTAYDVLVPVSRFKPYVPYLEQSVDERRLDFCKNCWFLWADKNSKFLGEAKYPNPDREDRKSI